MSARRAAYEVVRRTFEEGAYADRIFPAEAERARLDDRDRRLAMRLAYGTVQRKGTPSQVQKPELLVQTLHFRETAPPAYS